jgi:hypothetical protein
MGPNDRDRTSFRYVIVSYFQPHFLLTKCFRYQSTTTARFTDAGEPPQPHSYTETDAKLGDNDTIHPTTVAAALQGATSETTRTGGCSGPWVSFLS